MKLKLIGTLILIAGGLSCHTLAFAGDEIVIEGFDTGQKGSHPVKVEIPNQQRINQYSAQLFHQAGDPVVGNGNVTLVEFFDYRCSHCNRMSPIVAEFIRNNHNVRVVFKEFPVLGDVSVYAAKAALAAQNQGKFYQFHNALMKVGRDLSQESVMGIAKSVGLDIAKLTADMDSAVIDEKIQRNHQIGQQLKLLGTPIFFIENKTALQPYEVIVGETDLAKLQALTHTNVPRPVRGI